MCFFNFAVFVIENYNDFAIGDFEISSKDLASFENVASQLIIMNSTKLLAVKEVPHEPRLD